MFLAPLLIALASSPATALDAKEVRSQFVQSAAKQDQDACLALWRAHPGHVLGVIDADLEGSLKLREKSAEPDLAKIAEMQSRALWGARIATEASGHPLIQDYTAAFVGWIPAEQKRFREGQAAYGRAMKALSEKQADKALAAGLECIQLTGPLGDWWGSAMGCSAIAGAYQALGNHEKALESAGFARTLYHDLGLMDDECAVLTTMVECCRALGRTERAKVSCDAAIALAKTLKDEESLRRLTEWRAQLGAPK